MDCRLPSSLSPHSSSRLHCQPIAEQYSCLVNRWHFILFLSFSVTMVGWLVRIGTLRLMIPLFTSCVLHFVALAHLSFFIIYINNILSPWWWPFFGLWMDMFGVGLLCRHLPYRLAAIGIVLVLEREMDSGYEGWLADWRWFLCINE